jgi:hypothetical protein
MALEVDRCEILFSYWLAKIKARKKSGKMLRCRHSQSSGKPSPISQQNQYSSRIFAARLLWTTVDVGKHKT